MRMPEVKSRIVDTINMKTLLRLRNLWYLVDLAFQVPRDIILDPLTIGILPDYLPWVKSESTFESKLQVSVDT